METRCIAVKIGAWLEERLLEAGPVCWKLPYPGVGILSRQRIVGWLGKSPMAKGTQLIDWRVQWSQ